MHSAVLTCGNAARTERNSDSYLLCSRPPRRRFLPEALRRSNVAVPPCGLPESPIPSGAELRASFINLPWFGHLNLVRFVENLRSRSRQETPEVFGSSRGSAIWRQSERRIPEVRIESDCNMAHGLVQALSSRTVR
jgi:hypothetical protein